MCILCVVIVSVIVLSGVRTFSPLLSAWPSTGLLLIHKVTIVLVHSSRFCAYFHSAAAPSAYKTGTTKYVPSLFCFGGISRRTEEKRCLFQDEHEERGHYSTGIFSYCPAHYVFILMAESYWASSLQKLCTSLDEEYADQRHPLNLYPQISGYGRLSSQVVSLGESLSRQVRGE